MAQTARRPGRRPLRGGGGRRIAAGHPRLRAGQVADGAWTDITPAGEAGKPFRAVAADPADPADPGHLLTSRHWWRFYNPVFRSTDGGDTFRKVPAVGRAHLLAFGIGRAGRSDEPATYVYGDVGGEWGVFRPDDLGRSWVPVSDETNTVAKEPTALAADRRVFGRVYLATAGRGVFVGEPAAGR